MKIKDYSKIYKKKALIYPKKFNILKQDKNI